MKATLDREIGHDPTVVGRVNGLPRIAPAPEPGSEGVSHVPNLFVF